jgi:hypothetical protein
VSKEQFSLLACVAGCAGSPGAGPLKLRTALGALDANLIAFEEANAQNCGNGLHAQRPGVLLPGSAITGLGHLRDEAPPQEERQDERCELETPPDEAPQRVWNHPALCELLKA